MSRENIVEFLGSEEVFESHGNEIQFKEIMEKGNSDIETVAQMGQFLLQRFMDQNEEINSLRANLSERNQEMKHLKERQKYLRVIEDTYRAATAERELELENLTRLNYGYQQEIRRLQRKVVSSNETETSLRKSIFELSRSRKGWTFRSETFRYFPTRNYCLLCLSSKDLSSEHKEESKDLLEQLTLACNTCSRLEQDIQNENRQKKILAEKLLALRKEADALTQYLQWSGRADKDPKSNNPGKTSEPGEMFEVPTTEISDGCVNAVDRTTQEIQELQTGKGGEDVKLGKSAEMPEVAAPEIRDEECNTVVERIAQKTQEGQHSQLLHGPQPKTEKQNPESGDEEETKCEREKGVPVDPKEKESKIRQKDGDDDPNMHSSLYIVDGMCQACKPMVKKNPRCIKNIFKALIAFFRSLLHEK